MNETVLVEQHEMTILDLQVIDDLNVLKNPSYQDWPKVSGILAPRKRG